jgi:hypothetical protein
LCGIVGGMGVGVGRVLVLVGAQRGSLGIASVGKGSLNVHGLCSRCIPPRTATIISIPSRLISTTPEATRIISCIEARTLVEGLVGIGGLLLKHALGGVMALGRVVLRGLVGLAILIVCHGQQQAFPRWKSLERQAEVVGAASLLMGMFEGLVGVDEVRRFQARVEDAVTGRVRIASLRQS